MYEPVRYEHSYIRNPEGSILYGLKANGVVGESENGKIIASVSQLIQQCYFAGMYLFIAPKNIIYAYLWRNTYKYI